MKRLAKKFLPLLIVLALMGCQSTQEETRVVLTTGFEHDEVFRINQEPCRKAELMVYLTNLKNQYEQIYGEQIWEKEAKESTLVGSVKEVALARIAQIKVMKLLAAQKGITLTKEELAKVEEAANQYYLSLSPEEISFLEVDQLLIGSMYQEYALANKLYAHIIKDINPEISDDEARTITVEQIFLRCYSLNGKGEKVAYTEKQWQEVSLKAQEVRALAAGGGDFTKLSEQYSDHQSGAYSFGKGEVEQAFETASFNLGTDEISEVVKGEDGYYIIKCISTFNREETEANKINIVEERKKEVFNLEYNTFLQTLTRNMNDKLIEAIVFPEDSQVDTADFFAIYDETFGISG